jgi:uncharacterized C2H2 Zn-finger protein
LHVTENTGNDPIRQLAEQVDLYSRQAEEVARMVVGHHLLECPGCGLAEDALADLTVRVVHPDHPGDDTGLRFESLEDDAESWSCPNCGMVFGLEDETDRATG